MYKQTYFRIIHGGPQKLHSIRAATDLVPGGNMKFDWWLIVQLSYERKKRSENRDIK